MPDHHSALADLVAAADRWRQAKDDYRRARLLARADGTRAALIELTQRGSAAAAAGRRMRHAIEAARLALDEAQS